MLPIKPKCIFYFKDDTLRHAVIKLSHLEFSRTKHRSGVVLIAQLFSAQIAQNTHLIVVYCPRACYIYPGQFYTLLSRARSSNTVRILNFDKTNIVVSDLVKAEMERLRRDCVFSWKHPILQNERIKICLLNIVSWNLHILHVLSDRYIMNYSHVCLFCVFT